MFPRPAYPHFAPIGASGYSQGSSGPTMSAYTTYSAPVFFGDSNGASSNNAPRAPPHAQFSLKHQRSKTMTFEGTESRDWRARREHSTSSSPSLGIPGVSSSYARYPRTMPPLKKYNKCWCFFDVETTGPSLERHFMPALGLAIVALGDARNGTEPVLLASHKWFIKPPDSRRQWDEATLRDFWLRSKTRPLYERVCAQLLSPSAVDARTAMREFVDLCRHAAKHMSRDATVLSDTSGFDFSWLYYYMSHYGPADCPSPSMLFGKHKHVRDISSYFAGSCSNIGARYPHRAAMRRHGIDENEWHSFARRVNCPLYDHDPEHDAVHIALRSAWLMWKIESKSIDEENAPVKRANESVLLMFVRSDLRLSDKQIQQHCGLALDQLAKNIGNTDGATGGAQLVAQIDSVQRWKVGDAEKLQDLLQTALMSGLSHAVNVDARQVPTVLVVGPTSSAASVRKLATNLKPL